MVQDHNLSELVASGDRACASQEGEQLAAVAHMLAGCVETSLQLELDRVTRLAAVDLPAAVEAWTAVTDRLLRRGVCRARGAEPPAFEAAAR